VELKLGNILSVQSINICFQSSHSGIETYQPPMSLLVAERFQSSHSGIETLEPREDGKTNTFFQSSHSGIETRKTPAI